MTFERFDVVVVPFPFTDSHRSKRRPALVISDAPVFQTGISNSVLAMVTSVRNSPWPLDVILDDPDAAGLPAPSKVRMKLFTLDHRLIQKKVGTLDTDDAHRVESALRTLLRL